MAHLLQAVPDSMGVLLAAAAAVAIFRFKMGMISVLLASAFTGMTYYLVVASI